MEKINSSFQKENGLKMEIIDLDNGFFPNTDITGNIIIKDNSINPDSIILNLEIEENISNSNKILFSEKKILDEHILEVNNLKTIDFTFPIPDDLKPSFEYHLNKYNTFIRYYLIGKCSFNDKVYSCSYIIFIKGKYNEEYFQNKFDVKTNISNFYSNLGQCETTVYVDKKYITFDEEMNCKLEIHNEQCSCDISNIKVTIQRNVYFTSSDKKNIINEKTINDRIWKKIFVKKGKSLTNNLSINLNKNEKINFVNWINPYNNKTNFYLIPSVDTTNIKCEYNLKITLYLKGNFINKDHRPRIIIPIIIGHQTKEEYDRIKKQKNQSVFNSDFLLNQFAERKSLYDYISIEKDDNNDFIF